MSTFIDLESNQSNRSPGSLDCINHPATSRALVSDMHGFRSNTEWGRAAFQRAAKTACLGKPVMSTSILFSFGENYRLVVHLHYRCVPRAIVDGCDRGGLLLLFGRVRVHLADDNGPSLLKQGVGRVI